MRLLKKCKTLRAALGGRLARMGRRGRWELSVPLGLALALSLSSFTRFSAACAGVREDTLRLHILANSDSEADQELKLAVRDAILQAEGGMFAAERTKEGALRAAGADLEAIRAVAQRTVRARGYSYPVAVRLENMYFSTREYDGFTLPAGRYDAVRVEIGAHAGKNWFCVLFPPMCVPAATSDGGQDMSAYSGAEQQAVCSSYKVGFAAVEWLEGLKESLSGQGCGRWPRRTAGEQDDEAQEEADGAEQDARRADKKETASRAGTEHSGGRTVTTADRTQAQAARTAD
ncbi:stage II sporulation protein R [Ruthenibacterium lactatiformans]|uniref:stage II sporulation protein R n=1 Tax=Ruthenibacterium lactatiformans TaxID=1550024 RepID=UPI00399FF9A8